MQQSGSGGSGNQGNMQKIGEGLGGMVGQMADNALSMFGPMLNNMGGWWAQAGSSQQQGGGQVHASFDGNADSRCRNHFEARGQAGGGTGSSSVGGATGSMSGGGASGSMHASGSTGGGASGGISAQGSTQGRSRSYEEVRPLYQFGHMAGQNPDYQGRAFHEIEGDLQSHWGSEQSQQHGSWPDVRGFVEFGYSGRQPGGSSSAGGASGSAGGMNASGGSGGSSGSTGGFRASGSIDTTGGSGGSGNTGP